MLPADAFGAPGVTRAADEPGRPHVSGTNLTSCIGRVPHVSGANLMYPLLALYLIMVVCNLAGLYHVHLSQYVMRDNLSLQHGDVALANLNHKQNAA